MACWRGEARGEEVGQSRRAAGVEEAAASVGGGGSGRRRWRRQWPASAEEAAASIGEGGGRRLGESELRRREMSQGWLTPVGTSVVPGCAGGGGIGRVQPCPLAKLDSSFSTGQG
jgi:hypothetical protein